MYGNGPRTMNGSGIMALVSCPECNHEVSETAEACPHCGYVILQWKSPQHNSTELGQVRKNPIGGIILIAIGVLLILVGLATNMTGFLILGIIGAGMIRQGFVFINGTLNGTCPYCGNSVSVSAAATTFTCSHCKNISAKKENQLVMIVQPKERKKQRVCSNSIT